MRGENERGRRWLQEKLPLDVLLIAAPLAIYFQRRYFGGEVETSQVEGPGDVCPSGASASPPRPAENEQPA
jgi:hypothetical protein